jgi:putative ABC transport system substrate-binding protein
MYSLRRYVETGGMMSYAADLNDIWRRAALFVDKIWGRFSQSPVERPTKFDLRST